MNKVVIAAGIVALGAGGFFYTQHQASQSVSILNQIPSDTAFVSAQLKPIPVEKFLSSTGTIPKIDSILELTQTDLNNMSKREAFFVSLGTAFFNAYESADAYKEILGAPDLITSYMYLVGLAPVFKFDVSNEKAFWATFDKAESESNFTHTAKKIGDLSYRSYSLAEDNNQTKLELVVSVAQGMATVTVDSADFGSASPLKIALGIEAPTQSIAQADTLNQLLLTHPKLGTDSVGYLNHQQVVTGLTTTEGNLFAKHITKINELSQAENPSNKNPFEKLQSDKCKTEMAGIAANWPRTVFGSSFKDDGTMDATVLVESNNTVVLNALKTLRGFVPTLTGSKESALSIGLGLDVNQLAPSLNTIWQESLAVQYNCEPLFEIQTAIREVNPAMVGMATGFVNGLKGVSFNLFDYGFGKTEYGEDLNMLDASISISAENPISLFQAAQMIEPTLAQIQIPSDGTPVAVPPQLAEQFADIGSVFVASKGNHLTIYTGESATKASTELFSQALESNGLYNGSINYKKLFGPFVEMMKRNGETVPTELEPLIQNEMTADMQLDVLDKGISFQINNMSY